MSNTPIPDGRSQRRIDNAARIYDAAMRLLKTRAYRDLSVDEICEEAGVGRATFFRIFETKAGLVREFNRRMADGIQRRLAAGEATGVAHSLGIVVDEAVDTWTEMGPGVTEMAVEYIHSAESGDLRREPELLDLVVTIVEEGMKTGEIRGSNPALLTGALALMHIASAAAYWMEHRDSDLRRTAREALDVWLHGALAHERRP
jgi:AcrR family transcriptional regulator